MSLTLCTRGSIFQKYPRPFKTIVSKVSNPKLCPRCYSSNTGRTAAAENRIWYSVGPTTPGYRTMPTPVRLQLQRDWYRKQMSWDGGLKRYQLANTTWTLRMPTDRLRQLKNRTQKTANKWVTVSTVDDIEKPQTNDGRQDGQLERYQDRRIHSHHHYLARGKERNANRTAARAHHVHACTTKSSVSK